MSLFSARPKTLEDRWTDIFRRDTLIHVALMASITAATFQGYLKDRFAGPLPYAAADLLFIVAAGLWFASLTIRRSPIAGPGPVPMMVIAVVFLPAAYLLYPGTPLPIELAGLRAWSEFPVACLIALTTIQSAGQARAYVGLILILCVVTAVYGIWQYSVGPDVVLDIGEFARLRHGTSTFYSIAGTGETDFRAYSTFTFPAPFAAMMVFGIVLSVAAATSPHRPLAIRWVCGALTPLFFVGMTVSGTRAALVILLVGLAVFAWYRGLSVGQIFLFPLLLVALHVATVLTAGRIVERYSSVLLQEGVLWTYLYAPITIAGRALAEQPFGMGLGRTGVGVPFPITSSMPSGYFVFSDGDIGRAAVELGIIGLVILAVIVFGIIPYAMRSVRYLSDSRVDDIALGIGALVVSTGIVLLIGSPLSSAPHGTIWWFMLGILFRLTILTPPPTLVEKPEEAAVG